MERLKRAAAIHDISGFGKCSLTVALPIISAMGIEVSVIPTAVLSTHTGGFTGFTYRDLTGDMRPIAEHWKSLGIKFDAIYSGFLGSVEQIDIVTDFIDDFKEKNTVVLVDPAMADGGKMYTVFDMDFAKQMARLCAKADIIVPNFTEAAFMLGEEYRPAPYSKEYVESTLRRLSCLGPSKVVHGSCIRRQTGRLGIIRPLDRRDKLRPLGHGGRIFSRHGRCVRERAARRIHERIEPRREREDSR